MAAKSGTSKTSRAAVNSSAKQRAVPAADIDRIVPLGGGRFAYVYHPNGQSIRVAVNSDAFVEAVKSVAAAGYGDRIKLQVEREAAANPESFWASMRDFLESNDAYAAA